jgi:hypothetical protein
MRVDQKTFHRKGAKAQRVAKKNSDSPLTSKPFDNFAYLRALCAFALRLFSSF